MPKTFPPRKAIELANPGPQKGLGMRKTPLIFALAVFGVLTGAGELAAQEWPLPCVQYFVAGQPFCETYYSNPAKERQPQDLDANTVVVPTAFGWVVVNTTNGQSQYRGYATPEVANRPTDACPFPQVIDRHQSVNGWRTAGGAFIVAGNYGSAPTCKNIQVMTRQGSTSLGFSFIGDYDISNAQGAAFVGAQNASSTVGISMPFAYWPWNSTTGPPWAEINIGVGSFVVGSNFQGPQPSNTWEVIEAPVMAAAVKTIIGPTIKSEALTGKLQRSVDSKGLVTATAVAAQQYVLRRKGGPVPTPAPTLPAPTPTPTPTATAPPGTTPTPTRTPGNGSCNCPTPPVYVLVTATPGPN